MKQSFLVNISKTSLNVIISQFSAFTVFLLISRYLEKLQYGELNFAVALSTFLIAALSFQLDQIAVRKVAAGEDASEILTVFTWHVVIASLVFYLILLINITLFPQSIGRKEILFMTSLSQLLLLFSSPFKQIITGKGRFGYLIVMSSVANTIRLFGLLGVIALSSLTIEKLLVLFIFSSLMELAVSFYILNRVNIRFKKRVYFRDYKLFLLHSSPHIAAALLNISIARIDWIILGYISTPYILAEYSFAYKIFELSPLPVLVLAPVMLNKFSAYFKEHTEEALLGKTAEISLFIRIECILGTFFPLMLNIVWSPLIDALTNNKYGEVNKVTFFILSLCIPFQYMINLFWTINFSINKLKLILKVTFITCLILVAANLILIPLFSAYGAAIAFLIAICIQWALYLRTSVLSSIRDAFTAPFYCLACALISGFTAIAFTGSVSTQLLISFIFYAVLILITGQFGKNDLIILKPYLNAFRLVKS